MRHLSIALIFLFLFVVVSQTLEAQTPDVCDVRPEKSQATPVATFAVASNFYDPALDIAGQFTATGAPGAGYTIKICHNSSGILVREINGGNPAGYSLFLAADAVYPNKITPALIDGLVFSYARGIPVAFSSFLTLGQMIAGAGTTDAKFNEDNVHNLAIGNIPDAPYGVAAKEILDDTFQWDTPSSDPNCTSSPSWAICMYANIALTYQALIANPPKQEAGIIGKSQICPGLSTKVYYDFGSKYYINQSGVKIKVGGSSNTWATTFVSYLTDPGIQSYLVSNWCYAAATKAETEKIK
jgi:ABC-type molybdate transport system substrate-binding protein